MNIKLMRVNKKINSTSRTAIATYDTTAQYLSPCSDLNPELELHVKFGDREIGYYNMIKIEDRYYNITNIVYENYNLCRVSCSIDVLVTYKDQILNTRQYITRTSDPNKFILGEKIVDNTYPALSNVKYIKSETANLWTFDQQYIIGLIGGKMLSANDEEVENIFGVGAVKYYVINRPDLQSLVNKLLTLSGVAADVNPLQYIASIMEVPFQMLTTPVGVTSILVGKYTLTLGITAYRLTYPLVYAGNRGIYTWLGLNQKNVSIDIPKNPNAVSKSYYSQPWSKYTLYAGPFGAMTIDGQYAVDNSTLSLECGMDISTGKGYLRVYDEYNGNIIAETVAQLGINVQISQLTSNSLTGVVGTGLQLASSIAGFATGNVMGGISGITGAIVSAYENAIPKMTSQGNNGGYVDYSIKKFILICEYYDTVEKQDALFGRPIYATVSMDSFANGSYIQIDNPIISIPGAKNPEIESIISFMQKGFYIE